MWLLDRTPTRARPSFNDPAAEHCPSGLRVTPRSRPLAALTLAALVLAYALPAGALALRRHANLESQALDMGYADQVTWNMTQGRLYRFTPFRGIVGNELGHALQYGP